MNRFSVCLFAGSAALLASTAWAAPMHQRVRGTDAGVSGDILTVRTMDGLEVPVVLGSATRYLEVKKSTLGHVEPGSYIGTAAKSIGNTLVALEVVVFPPSMRGTGEGHYSWDRIPDTTLTGHATTGTTMTNGTVSAAMPAVRSVSSTMTNGTVGNVTEAGGAKQITVTYKGGKQVIIVPPTAPIVTYLPGSESELKQGNYVFVNGMSQDGKVIAASVAVGIDGVNPPM